VTSIDDDRRQKNEEEGSSVELVTVGGVSEGQQQTHDHSQDDQHTALRHRTQQPLQLSVVR